MLPFRKFKKLNYFICSFKLKKMYNTYNKMDKVVVVSKGDILIVEDEAFAANDLQTILETNGYTVVDICSRGKDAIKSAIHYKPDLIFMDIMLKDGLSGSEAALEITNMINTKIIFLTSYYNDEMAEYAIESNAASYIIKPFSEPQILANLKIALKDSIFKKPKHLIELKDGFIYDTQKDILIKGEQTIELKEKGKDIFKILIDNLDTPVTYKEIIDYVYGGDGNKSALRAYISRLNRNFKYTLIENLSGIGYKISSKID